MRCKYTLSSRKVLGGEGRASSEELESNLLSTHSMLYHQLVDMNLSKLWEMRTGEAGVLQKRILGLRKGK